jgi:hypothetical protein
MLLFSVASGTEADGCDALVGLIVRDAKGHLASTDDGHAALLRAAGRVD